MGTRSKRILELATKGNIEETNSSHHVDDAYCEHHAEKIQEDRSTLLLTEIGM